jgi:hypothetical protein
LSPLLQEVLLVHLPLPLPLSQPTPLLCRSLLQLPLPTVMRAVVEVGSLLLPPQLMATVLLLLM